MPNGLKAVANPGMVLTNIQSHGPGSMLRYALLFVLAAIIPALAQPVTDYLNIPGPIALGDTSYELAWSAQPAPDYTKQEYVPAGQSVDNFESMVIVEFLVGDATPASIAQSQIAMLEERKTSDPLVNMDLLVNDASGEIILDFVVSAADANGDIWEAGVDSAAELIDMVETARQYQNNVQVMQTAKSLTLDTLRIGK